MKIRILADYGCNPLWWNESHNIYNIKIEELPLSNSTKEALHQWALLFDSYLDWDDPSNTPDLSIEEIKRFESEGLRLWLLLINELGSNYQIRYDSNYLHQIYEHPNELKEALLTTE